MTYYLVMAGVGLLISDDILAAHPWARDFSDSMASIVPQIDRISDAHKRRDEPEQISPGLLQPVGRQALPDRQACRER